MSSGLAPPGRLRSKTSEFSDFFKGTPHSPPTGNQQPPHDLPPPPTIPPPPPPPPESDASKVPKRRLNFLGRKKKNGGLLPTPTAAPAPSRKSTPERPTPVQGAQDGGQDASHKAEDIHGDNSTSPQLDGPRQPRSPHLSKSSPSLIPTPHRRQNSRTAKRKSFPNSPSDSVGSSWSPRASRSDTPRPQERSNIAISISPPRRGDPSQDDDDDLFYRPPRTPPSLPETANAEPSGVSSGSPANSSEPCLLNITDQNSSTPALTPPSDRRLDGGGGSKAMKSPRIAAFRRAGHGLKLNSPTALKAPTAPPNMPLPNPPMSAPPGVSSMTVPSVSPVPLASDQRLQPGLDTGAPYSRSHALSFPSSNRAGRRSESDRDASTDADPHSSQFALKETESLSMEAISGQLAELVHRHDVEKSLLERRIEALELQAAERDKEIKGLRYLITVNGGSLYGPITNTPSSSKRHSRAIHRSHTHSHTPSPSTLEGIQLLQELGDNLSPNMKPDNDETASTSSDSLRRARTEAKRKSVTSNWLSRSPKSSTTNNMPSSIQAGSGPGLGIDMPMSNSSSSSFPGLSATNSTSSATSGYLSDAARPSSLLNVDADVQNDDRRRKRLSTPSPRSSASASPAWTHKARTKSLEHVLEQATDMDDLMEKLQLVDR